MKIIKKVLSLFKRKKKVANIKSLKADSNFNIPPNCVFSGNIKFGKHSTINANSFFRGNITIGNYCQFGAYISMHSRNHPSNYLTIYNNRRLFRGKLKELLIDEPINIGNDVWLGHGVIVLSGVSIGNGAIIGAGSVVTKNIPDFAIAVGVPAKVIRFRFPETIQKQITDLEWWNKDIEELEKMEDLFFKDLSALDSIDEILNKSS